MRGIEAAAERVLRNAVDEHERVVGFAAAREERRHRAAAAVLDDAEAGREAQRVRDDLRLQRAQIGALDDGDAVGHARERLIDLRGRDDDRFADGRDRELDVGGRRRRAADREFLRADRQPGAATRSLYSPAGRAIGPKRPSADVFAVATTPVPWRISTSAQSDGLVLRIEHAAAHGPARARHRAASTSAMTTN